MTTVDGRHELDREAERLAYKPPEIRHDKQGDVPDEERINQAMHHFVKDFNTQTASYLDGCLHCGMCADACHFHVRTDDPRYTPIWKIELFKRTYKRQVGPFAFFYRLLGLKRHVTIKDLEEWQHLLYDSCTVCGRCSLVCPMGIDIAGLVSMARHGMFKAGLIPHELHEVAKTAAETGSPLGISGEKFAERAEWMGDEHDVEIPMDEEQADVLAVMSSIEINKYPESMAATAKILNAAGESWTFRTYMALRWMGANMLGKPLPFKVLHISEYMADALNTGKIKVQKVDKSVTYHDPCQVSRRGGATQSARDVLKHLGVDFREMEYGGDYNWCCGGGGGVVTIKRADPLRHRVFKLKMDQVEKTEADELLSSCANCRQSFDDSQQHFNWDYTMGSLMEMVAENLEEGKQ
jgi:Fe-S oxidoreductase